jgi:hypothetical protein
MDIDAEPAVDGVVPDHKADDQMAREGSSCDL